MALLNTLDALLFLLVASALLWMFDRLLARRRRPWPREQHASYFAPLRRWPEQ